MIRWATVDVATGALRHEGGDEVLPAASTIKLFVASAFWRSRLDPAERVAVPAAGSSGVAEHLDRPTLGDLAFLALAASDNAATNVLLARLGLEAVNAEVARVGLEQTIVRRPMMADGPENLTTAAEAARGLAALSVDAVWPELARGLTAAAETVSILPAYLPSEVRLYPKSGELETVRHEVALLERGGRRLSVAVLSSPPAAPHDLARRLGQLWQQH